eukprot:4055547-Pleurochrysis_carterae.AAC.2
MPASMRNRRKGLAQDVGLTNLLPAAQLKEGGAEGRARRPCSGKEYHSPTKGFLMHCPPAGVPMAGCEQAAQVSLAVGAEMNAAEIDATEAKVRRPGLTYY